MEKSIDKKKLDLFSEEFSIEKEWQGMPEYSSLDLMPYKKLIILFRNEEDRQAFAELVQQPLKAKTKSIWYPKMEICTRVNHVYIQRKNKKKKKSKKH